MEVQDRLLAVTMPFIVNVGPLVQPRSRHAHCNSAWLPGAWAARLQRQTPWAWRPLKQPFLTELREGRTRGSALV